MDFDNRKVYGDTSITDGLVIDDVARCYVQRQMFKLILTQNHLKQPSNKIYLCHKIVAVPPSLSFRLTDAWVHYGIEM